ncbi:MAG: hypothetical protein AAF431_06090 [Pseudomonadota bacterium]
MNLEKLKLAEQRFLSLHPEGFADPSMAKVLKRHKMEQMVEFAQQSFSPDCYSHVEQKVANMVKTVSRSSMVSMFEKPKFRDFVQRLDASQKAYMVDSLVELLHGQQQLGFEALVDLFKTEKIAKWSLMTIIPAYHAPDQEVFVKPTTAKGVINYFEVPELVYKPAPTWEFYQGYRRLINSAKKKVDQRLSPSNAAFSGFLMMSLDS